MSEVNLANRDVRQRDLVPAPRLNQVSVLVIGLGAIGRQVATILASLGVELMTLVDFDKVGVENLAVQGYRPDQLGQLKVAANRELEQVNPGKLFIQAVDEPFSENIFVSGLPYRKLVTFVCVDDIDVRKDIWNKMRRAPAFSESFELLIDGRMAGENFEVYSFLKEDPVDYYQKTFFPKSETYPMPCTAKSTLYTSYTVAGVMVGEFVKWLRDRKEAMCLRQSLSMSASEFSADYR